jgi:prepilin-type N-terminal cleavage/methylation domain-containing protein
MFKCNNQFGFTLLEQLIVVSLIGILASLAAPSFLGMYYRSKIDSATNTLRNAIQEAQRQAIMKSKDCAIFLPITDTKDAKITSDCFVLGDRLLNEVNLRHNYASKSNTIVFNYRGQANGLGTFVLDKQGENISYQKCLVISNHIGMSRLGIYNVLHTTGANASNCETIK